MVGTLLSPVAIVFLTLLLDKLGETIVYPLLPYILEPFNPDGLTIGLVTSVSTAVAVVAGPLAGSFSDAWGRRPILLFCVGLNAVSLLLFGWAGTLPLIIFSRALNGIAISTVGTAQACIADLSTPANRTRNLGLAGAAFGIGAIAGPALGGGLVGFGPRIPIFVSAALAGLNFVMVLMLLAESLPAQARMPFRRRAFDVMRPILSLLWREQTRSISIAFALFNLSFSGFTSLLVLSLKTSLGWQPLQVTGIFIVVGLTMTYVQIAWIGRLSARLGDLRLSQLGLYAVALGIALQPVAVQLPSLAAVLMVIAAILLATGAAFMVTAARSLVSSSAPPDQQGVILGSFASLAGVASVIGPIAGGFIYDLSAPVSFLLQALICLVGGRIVGFIPTQASPAGRRPG